MACINCFISFRYIYQYIFLLFLHFCSPSIWDLVPPLAEDAFPPHRIISTYPVFFYHSVYHVHMLSVHAAHIINTTLFYFKTVAQWSDCWAEKKLWTVKEMTEDSGELRKCTPSGVHSAHNNFFVFLLEGSRVYQTHQLWPTPRPWHSPQLLQSPCWNCSFANNFTLTLTYQLLQA